MIDIDDPNIDSSLITVRYEGGMQVPKYQTPGSSGADITSSEEITIPAGERRIVPTGIKLNIPKGFECQVRSRSGLAAKEGIFVLNGIGTIDSDYQGEIKVILANFSNNDFYISPGDRIAQLVFAPVTIANFVKSDLSQVEKTERSSGGFGSTGVS